MARVVRSPVGRGPGLGAALALAFCLGWLSLSGGRVAAAVWDSPATLARLHDKARACRAADRRTRPDVEPSAVPAYCSCLVAHEAILDEGGTGEPGRESLGSAARTHCVLMTKVRMEDRPEPVADSPALPAPKPVGTARAGSDAGEAKAGAPPGLPPEAGRPWITEAERIRILDQARDEAGVPREVAAAAISRCVDDYRGRFPRVSNGFVAAACSCFGARIKALPPSDAGAAYDRAFSAGAQECGALALLGLSQKPDVFGTLLEETVPACRRSPKDFGASSPEQAEQVCGCMLAGAAAKDRAAIVMWRHLGAEAGAKPALAEALRSCLPERPGAGAEMPFQGAWYPSRVPCAAPPPAMAERGLLIEARRMRGYEHVCTISTLTRRGTKIDTEEACTDNDSSTYKVRQSYELVGKDSLRIISGKQVTVLRRCIP